MRRRWSLHTIYQGSDFLSLRFRAGINPSGGHSKLWVVTKMMISRTYYVAPPPFPEVNTRNWQSSKRELSSSAFAALEEFYNEREVTEKRFEDLKAGLNLESPPSVALSMDMFSEDWNASQFWVFFYTRNYNLENLSDILSIAMKRPFRWLKSCLRAQPRIATSLLFLLPAFSSRSRI